ncbi:MAG: RNA methyltransferase [Solobacterium sp.]|nr:RNA methyltransferase [Solobacterium sp.]
MKIESLQNQYVKQWTKLHEKKERDKTGLFLVEGEHLITEALHAGIVQKILCTGEDPFDFPDCIEVTEPVMKKISQNVSGAKYIAVCVQKELTADDAKRVILLDDVQDPGNFGTIIRTARSFGFEAIYTSKKTCDLYNEKVIRSTQGALFTMPVIRCNLAEKIRELKTESFRVIGTALKDAVPMSRIEEAEKMAFLFGNEGQGVHPELLDACDQRLFIEIGNFESLNVAVAAGIVMYRYRG